MNCWSWIMAFDMRCAATIYCSISYRYIATWYVLKQWSWPLTMAMNMLIILFTSLFASKFLTEMALLLLHCHIYIYFFLWVAQPPSTLAVQSSQGSASGWCGSPNGGFLRRWTKLKRHIYVNVYQRVLDKSTIAFSTATEYLSLFDTSMMKRRLVSWKWTDNVPWVGILISHKTSPLLLTFLNPRIGGKLPGIPG